MKKINRLGLGCMGMTRNSEMSINTIRTAIDEGISLFNTGEFYQQGESEILVGKALKGVQRDKYFLSVKFGVLPSPGGGIYGLDVNPFHIKAHLTYSLRRLNMDYVDIYQPARMDTAFPVEDVVGEIKKLVDAGFVKHIGLSMVDAETLRRAYRVHPIHTVEMAYSLVNRDIENELIATAKELGVRVLAFGALGHGLFTDRTIDEPSACFGGRLSPKQYETTLQMLRTVREVANEKHATVSQLAIAWTLAKYDNIQALIGTTSPEHLRSAIGSTEIVLTQEDIQRLEQAVPKERFSGMRMRSFVFHNGRMTTAE